MKLPDYHVLNTDTYITIADQWRQEWERGVQVQWVVAGQNFLIRPNKNVCYRSTWNFQFGHQPLLFFFQLIIFAEKCFKFQVFIFIILIYKLTLLLKVIKASSWKQFFCNVCCGWTKKLFSLDQTVRQWKWRSNKPWHHVCENEKWKCLFWLTVVLKRNVAMSRFLSQKGCCSRDKNLEFSEISQTTIYRLKYQNPIV